tara:strand:- start:3662 stop:3880 length:219 start_codon:yes stop_codon:yes gene_type:complete
MCTGGGSRNLFTPTPLTPIAPPPPPEQIDLMGVPMMAALENMARNRPGTQAQKRRMGKMGGKSMMVIPKRQY